jgi:hypothetical protein
MLAGPLITFQQITERQQTKSDEFYEKAGREDNKDMFRNQSSSS